MEDLDQSIEAAAEAVKKADALIITAGAGIGVDSGLPDFRGNEGFWKAYPPIAKLGIGFSEMANPSWFEKKPRLAWAFYGHRLNLYRATQPHEGFYQLLDIGKSKPEGYFVFTSNVDGQFQKAGFDNECIEECHGSIHYFQCINSCKGKIWDASHEQVIVNERMFEAQEPLPACPHCGAVARPNILMFGDRNWEYGRNSKQGSRMNGWLRPLRTSRQSVAIIELGAGKAVPTVRIGSETLTQRVNGTLIRINPRDYQVPFGHVSISLGAKEGIQRIFELL